MKKCVLLLPLLLLALGSCNDNKIISVENNTTQDFFEVKDTSDYHEFIVVPVKVKAATPKSKILREANKSYYSTKSIIAKKPDSLKVTLRKSGKLATPEVVKSTTNPIASKVPQIVEVKDPSVKDVNPYNFFSYSKLHGLRQDQIRSMTNDRFGNLWLGTDDGLTRYDGKFFSHYTTEQGLNNNLVLFVYYDTKGNIWLGTFRGGVTKFDGVTFTTYTTENGLVNNVVNAIYEDKSGRMWFSTGGGISCFDGVNMTSWNDSDGLPNNDVRYILQDSSGGFWIATHGGGVSYFNEKEFFTASVQDGFPATHVGVMLKAKDGRILFGTTNNGLIIYDGKKFVNYTEKQGLVSNLIRSLMEDAGGNLWIGTADSGLSRFDGESFDNIGATEGLMSTAIKCSVQDYDGGIWFGTRGAGLVKYNGDKFRNITRSEGLSESRVISIAQDSDKNLWLGTFGGYVTKILERDSSGTKVFENLYYNDNSGLTNSRIYSVILDSKGRIVVGSDGGGITYIDKNSMSIYTSNEGLGNNAVRNVIQTKSGDYWISTYGGGISKFDGEYFYNYSKKNGFTTENILCSMEASDGKIWFATDGGGLFVYDGVKFRQFNKQKGFFSDVVYSLAQDKLGRIWIGTGGEGLICYDGKVFRRFDEQQGLNNNYIMSLLVDRDGNLISGTRFGINILKHEQIDSVLSNNYLPFFQSFGYHDGFTGIGTNLGSLFQSQDGTIYVGTNDRLTTFKIEDLVKVTKTPSLHLSGVKLFGETIQWQEIHANKDSVFVLGNGIKLNGISFNQSVPFYDIPEDLRLSHNLNYVTFDFIGISMSNSNQVKYQYYLDGLEDTWNLPSYKTEVSYANLGSGKYTFRVRTLDWTGKFSNEIAYSFKINPPWWRTIWFYFGLIALVISTIINSILYRERKLKKENELLERKVNDQTHELTDKNRELSQLIKEKDKLFSIIAHDLKGPFNSFLGLTQIMAEEMNNLTMNELKDIATKMKRSANNLYNLLDNLLTWSRIQQGALSFNPQKVSLNEATLDVCSLISETANTKGIDLKIEIGDDMFAFADQNMLDVVLRNLLSNAVKFSNRGGVVRVAAEVLAQDKILVKVSDQGIGMSAEMIQNLFKVNAKVNRSGTDGEPSTGLGLLLCKEFVEKNGGSIKVESKVGEGSTFSFTLLRG